MKIFYMNQGGGGNWGTVSYSNYNLLLIAEASGPDHFRIKSGFEELYNSNCKPNMSIQGDGGRLVTGIRDLDQLAKEVRPIVRFKITGTDITVVFVHLKSGSEKYATEALATAISQLKREQDEGKPILWVGDFNRADTDLLADELPKFKLIFKGGGQSKWNLDYVMITGAWKAEPNVDVATTAASDHGHVGLRIVL